MSYAIMLGSNMFIGTNGVFQVEKAGKQVEFFRIREIFRERAEGSYLTVDCDIRDKEGNREVKLFKNKPVAQNDDISVESIKSSVVIERKDGTTVLKIEQIKSDDSTIPKDGPILEFLKSNPVDNILRITGNFMAGDFEVNADNETFRVGFMTFSGNLSVGTGGLSFSSSGVSF